MREVTLIGTGHKTHKSILWVFKDSIFCSIETKHLSLILQHYCNNAKVVIKAVSAPKYDFQNYSEANRKVRKPGGGQN